jgi:hypothetical protein
VLDGAAKADQNLASLLLMNKSRKRRVGSGKESKVAEYCEKKFSKMLDDAAKSRLESRFFAADE